MDITDTVDRLERELAEVARLKAEERWTEAWQIVVRWLSYLVGREVNDLPKLTDTEWLAGMLSRLASYAAPYGRLMLIRLLQETGDIVDRMHPPNGGRAWYVRSLNLRLISQAQTDPLREFADLLPSVDSLVAAIGVAALPARTQILVMREYEREGQYGRMRDSFRGTLERVPDAPRLLAYGIITFTKLAERSDDELGRGGLARGELDELLAELKARNAQHGRPPADWAGMM